MKIRILLMYLNGMLLFAINKAASKTGIWDTLDFCSLNLNCSSLKIHLIYTGIKSLPPVVIMGETFKDLM